MQDSSRTPALAGFYFLARDGRLGYYDEDGQFLVDTDLSSQFSAYNRQFLRAYLDNATHGAFRLGVIYRSPRRRKWGLEVFALETALLRRLYCVNGKMTDAPLTEFQKKNREQSVYRAIELFLEHRNLHMPDAAIYAPVLLDRGGTLDGYPTILDRPVAPEDKDVRVFDVVNLLAGIPVPRRNTEQVHRLVKALHARVIRKDARREIDYGIVNGLTPRSLVFAADSILDRRPTGLRESGGQSAREPKNGWSDAKSEPIPSILSRFTQFQHLDDDACALLARENPLRRAPAGARLLSRGAIDRWNLFLVKGKVELRPADGATQIIEGGTARAASAISCLKPRKYDVTAITPVVFLWIHDLALSAISPSRLKMGAPPAPVSAARTQQPLAAVDD